MGGDHGTTVTIPAAVEYLKQFPDDTIVLVGVPDAIEAELRLWACPRHLRFLLPMVGDEQPQCGGKTRCVASIGQERERCLCRATPGLDGHGTLRAQEAGIDRPALPPCRHGGMSLDLGAKPIAAPSICCNSR
jgi:hypothetical protein